MLFNRHSELTGSHALLSASKHHWLNYSDQKIAAFVQSSMSAQRGTRLHEFAAMAIELKQKMPRNNKTLNAYVNDAIGFRMSPEVVLYYSPICFGTADAVGFRNDTLRIFDLKNGITPTSFNQLLIYAALFCHEYGMKPGEITTELRIYQNDDVKILVPDPIDVVNVMDKIVYVERKINELRAEALG